MASVRDRKPREPPQWIKDLQVQHNKFKFTTQTPQCKPQPVLTSNQATCPPHLYSEEKDTMNLLLKRIMYAEGDC